MSQNASAGSSPGVGPSVESLTRTIDQIETQLKEFQSAQKRTGRIIAVGTLAILVLMILFFAALWKLVNERLQPSHFSTALQAAAKQLEPQIRTQVTAAAEEIIPLYLQTAQEQLMADWPVIQQKLSAKTNEFPEKVRGMLVSDGQKMLDRVEKHLEKTLAKEFPGLDAEKGTKLAESLINHTALKSEKLGARLEKIANTELDKVQKILEKYPIADYAAMDRAALEKRTLRKVVQVIDYELEVHGSKEGLDFEELRKQGIIGSALLESATK